MAFEIPEGYNPWDWMQPHDTRRLGEDISDPAQRARWSTAVLIGGLPYLWRHKAILIRDMIYKKLDLAPGDKVLLIGESIESCGFDKDLREIVGPEGEIRQIDIIEEARDAVAQRRRGRNGKLGTWRYDYTSDVPDAYFDCVAVLQAVQHSDDWREAGCELLRVMKRGRVLVLAEIGFGPELRAAASLDLHLEYWIEKLFYGAGFPPTELAYFSPAELTAAFEGLLSNQGSFTWRGAELFWGNKL